MADKVLTTADLAARFGVTPQRIRALVKQRSKDGPIGQKHGRDWLFTEEEAERLRPRRKKT